MTRMHVTTALLLWLAVLLPSVENEVRAEPQSKPYIPFRTDPTDHPFVKHRISWDDDRSDRRRSLVKRHDPADDSAKHQCPLHFTLGVSRRAHHKAQNSNGFSIVKPPVIHPVFPAKGPGRQIVHTTLYEHMDLLSPEVAVGPQASSSSSVIKEGLIQHQEFPLLFESSSFAHASLIVHDVNGDGIPDAILSDYDGGIYIVGLHQGKNSKRWFHKTQVPRIFVRRTWVASKINETYKDLHPEEAEQEVEVDDFGSRDPFHSYFEYSSGQDQKDVLQGVTANVLGQKKGDLDALKDRRGKQLAPVDTDRGSGEVSNEESEGAEDYPNQETVQRRRLLETNTGDFEGFTPRGRLLEVVQEEDDTEQEISFPRRRLQEVDSQQQQQQQQQQREEEERRRQEEQRQSEEQERLERQERERQETEKREIVEREQQQQHREEEERQRRDREEQERREQEERQRREKEEQDRREQEESQRREREEQERREQEERQRREREEQERREQEDHQKAEAEHGQQQQQQQEVQQQQQQQQEVQAGLEQPKVEQVQDEQIDQPSEGAKNLGGTGETVEGEDEGRSESLSRSRSGRGDEDDIYPSDTSESNSYGDDMYPPDHGYGDEYPPDHGYGDDMYGGGAGGYDDYYGRYKSYRDDFYDEKHYVRVNPHILATPTLAEVPKLYGSDGEVEDILFVPVSYYLDEDEYEGHLSYRRFENTDQGDETEVQRGMYVASAIMLYQLGADPRWGRQEHLDLSTDFSSPDNLTLVGRIPVKQDNTKMGAFALSKPAVADIDGDGKMDLLMGTSMGIVYAFDLPHMTMKTNWPIQMQHAVESPILVEDVAANTKLETFVIDIGGNIACFDEEGAKVWHRDLRAAVSDGPSTVRASSPMTMGDVDGDGVLDIVVSLQIVHQDISKKESTYVVAMNGATGADIPNFPLSFDTPPSQRSDPKADWLHQQLPGLLLVDLHSDQSHIQDYIRRNATKWERRTRKGPGGGTAAGLHIVLPVGETLYIIEAGSGCIQNFGIGEDMVAMVQADDVHGTKNLDLVVSTTSGNIITMESTSPYHPLNVWNNGDIRGRLNNYAHGYSASQGIFVHAVSREYRDIFGVFVPITFEIFDNRPNIHAEPDKRVYKVEIRDGTSTKRALWRTEYNETGVYTERLYIPHGAGYYALTVQLRASNGIIYEDMFHIGYNVNYMDGFGLMLWLPLLMAAVAIFLGSSRKDVRWDDDDYEGTDRNGGGLGILG